MFNITITEFLEKNSTNWRPKDAEDPNWPWAPVFLDIDKDKVQEELDKLKFFFVPHRDKDKTHSYGHEGWSALTLHGLDYDKTEHYDRYGHTDESKYRWTEVCEYAPYIVSLIKSLPYDSFSRVRIMKLAAGGYIMPHNDGEGRIYGPLNVALTHPEGCRFVFEKYGEVPFRSGRGFILDIGINHCVVNASDQDRYHLIIHGRQNAGIHQTIDRSLGKL
jgi:hypothetical protein